jgi:predicted ATPase/class 3 adenylate cyclase
MGAPSGTVTFLFTDIEGSTRLWQQDEAVMRAAVGRHDQLLRHVVSDHGGDVFSTMGDGLAVAFPSASSAVAAAMAAQQVLGAEPWPTASPLRVRMGLHSGEAEQRDRDYFGTAVNRAARLMGVGSGGQVLCSASTAELVGTEVTLVDLGEHRLRDLDRPVHVFQVGAGRFPPLRSLDVLPGNLPVQPTRFVGRAAELERVAAGLEQSRLVTLTGVAGVGKTRLALQAAAERSPAFADGVWLVELAGLIDPDLVAPTLAAVLGVQVQAGRSAEDSLAEAFSARSVLLVLDNCEHVIRTAAALALRLVSNPGTSRVLATSREGLGVPGERVVAVPPLAVPDDDTPAAVLGSDAVRLFVERASDARDGFRVPDGDAPILARLCRRLDGIPLAIELAAARVRSITPGDILAHLDQRFRLLSAGQRTAPTRQQTLRNAIDWSHELLNEPERVMLRRLSVFGGGFDLAGVQAVCADATLDEMDVVDLLDRLVVKSLVALDLSVGATRYRLLESIRDYAWERLGNASEAAEFARRHAEYFAAFSERAGAELRGPDEGAWSRRVDAEMENLRLALAWAIEAHDADLALRVVGGLAVSGYRVGCPFGDAALDAAALEGAQGHRLRSLALASAAWTVMHRADLERATELAEAARLDARAVAAARDGGRVLGEVLAVLGSVCMIRPGFFDRAVTVNEEWHGLAVELDDAYLMVQVLIGRATLHGDREAAEEAVRIARTVGNPTMLVYSLAILAMLITEANPARARALLDEAGETAAAVGNPEATAVANGALGFVLYTLGDHLSAARMQLSLAEQFLSSGDRFFAYASLFRLVGILHSIGDDDSALRLGAWLVARVGNLHENAPAAAILANERVDEVLNQLRRLAPEDLERLTSQVVGMTDDDALALVSESVLHHDALAGTTAGRPPGPTNEDGVS